MRPRGLAGAPSPALSPKAFASGPKSDPPNNIPGVPAPGFYPADLDDPDQGPVVTRAQAHPVYINSGPSDFGNPAAFLDDLAESSFIHVVDQYTGSNETIATHAGSLSRSTAIRLPVTPFSRTT